MKKNKKGFTLIELLAVIVLLITISAIAIPTITASIERAKNKQREAKILVIEEAARLYHSENKVLLNANGFLDGNCYIPIYKLDLTAKELDDPLGDTFNGVVTYNNGKYNYVNTPNVGSCVGE